MHENDSESSFQEVEFSKKSSSSSNENLQQIPSNQNEQSQSDKFRNRSKFSESSDKSGLLSIEKVAFLKSKSKKSLEKSYDLNFSSKKINDLQEKAHNLEDFLGDINKNLDYDREMFNKREEVINLNSRLNQLYDENQSLEEKSSKIDNNLMIMTEEYGKCLNKITELEFFNKKLIDENNSFKQRINEFSFQDQMQKANIEKLMLENKHLNEKEGSLRLQNSKLFEEIKEKQMRIVDFADFKRKMEVFKEGFLGEINILNEEKFKFFLDENDFINLLKIFIKERTQLKEELKDKHEMVEKMEKISKCLEIQTRENRIVIEELSSQKKINENLSKINFELEAKVYKLQNQLEEKKTKENIISSIIQDHTQIKIELDRKDKIVAEILLLISFYEQIRLAYQEKSIIQENNETNIQDIQNLFAYSLFKEDLKNLKEKAEATYPDLMEKINELFQEKKILRDNESQSEEIKMRENFSQIEKDDGLVNFEEIQKENEKIRIQMEENQIFLQENVKLKEKTLKFYIEKLFGWKLLSDGKIIKLENPAKKVELLFLSENNEIVLLHKEEILRSLGNSQLREIPEIISYFTII